MTTQKTTSQASKKTTATAFEDLIAANQAEHILPAVARCISLKDKKGDDPPIPSLKQIQQTTAVVEKYKDVHIAPDNMIHLTFTEGEDGKLGAPFQVNIKEEGRIEVTGDNVSHKKIGDIYLYKVEGIHLEEIGFESMEALQEAMETPRVISAYSSAISAYFMKTAGEPDAKKVEWAHQMWKERREKNEQLEHPLRQVIERWLTEENVKHVTAESDNRRPAGVLKFPRGFPREITFTQNDVGQVFKTPERVEQAQQGMDFGEKSKLPSIMPLEVVQTADVKAQTRAGAVSHELRLFFEAMMALQPNQHREEMMFRLGDLIDFLYPNRKFHWTNQFPYIERALNALHSDATIPFIDDTGSLRRWRPVSVRSPVTKERITRETPIFFDVCLPPDAKQGHIVLKGIHRELGMQSAVQWNAYHVACYLWDKYGTTQGSIIDPTKPIARRDADGYLLNAERLRIVDERGKPIRKLYHREAVRQLDREPNPARVKYETLSFDELIQACYPKGFSVNKSAYLQRAKKAFQALADAGYIRIEKFPHQWRIMPSDEHIRIYRALKNKVY